MSASFFVTWCFKHYLYATWTWFFLSPCEWNMFPTDAECTCIPPHHVAVQLRRASRISSWIGHTPSMFRTSTLAAWSSRVSPRLQRSMRISMAWRAFSWLAAAGQHSAPTTAPQASPPSCRSGSWVAWTSGGRTGRRSPGATWPRPPWFGLGLPAWRRRRTHWKSAEYICANSIVGKSFFVSYIQVGKKICNHIYSAPFILTLPITGLTETIIKYV